MNMETSDQAKTGQSSLRVLNPVAILEFEPIAPAKRLTDLTNKKIGLYWNMKARGNVALDRVKEVLSERFAGMTFEWFEQHHSIEPSKEWFEKIKKSGVDGIVASTGD